MTHVILSPLGLALLCLALLGLGKRWVRSRWLARVTGSLLGLCLWLMTPWGANTLVHSLEGDQPQVPACAHDTQRQLVLLTGGLQRAATGPTDFDALSPLSVQRWFALQATGVLTEQRTLWISGGNADGGPSESRLVGELAVRMGWPRQQIRLDERATNTRENALQIAAMLGSQPKRVTVVTSALHMKRAVLAFEQQGLDVCPLPVGSVYVPPNSWGYVLPQSSALRKSEAALHEWLGWLMYRIGS